MAAKKLPKGTLVKIHSIILKASQRSPNLPTATQKVDLEMWTKGYLMAEAGKGDVVTVKTFSGRKAKGKIVEIEPAYQHTYGTRVPELDRISRDAKKVLWGKK